MQNRSLEQIKQDVRIEDVIRQHGVDLRATGNGGRLEGHCPFHSGDETPSFNVYIETQRYHCFGCGADGDVIDFVQAFDGGTFQDALHRLSEKDREMVATHRARDRILCPSVPFSSPLEVEADEQPWKERITETHHHYSQTLQTHLFLPEVLRRTRGITDEGIRRCELGYADGSWLPNLLETPAIQEAAETIGLLSATGQERMVGRLVIPECSEGRCFWMIGRALYAPLGRHRTPKYLGLSLSKPLLGYGLALKRLREGCRVQAILIVEGAIDYVIASQWDLPIVCVALVGTHASRRQLARLLDLQQRANHVPLLISLDADEAGRQASQQLLAQLRQQTPSVRELAPIADHAIKDIGDLGMHPHGLPLFHAALEQAMGTEKEGEQ
jgi:DNA primase